MEKSSTPPITSSSSSNSTIEPKKSELSKGAAAYLYSDDSPTKEESKQSKHLKVN